MSSTLQSFSIGTQGAVSVRAVLDFHHHEILGAIAVDLTGVAATEPFCIKKHPAIAVGGLVDLTGECEFYASVKKGAKLEAQRIVPYRDTCPDPVLLRLRRLDSQRLYVLDQTETGSLNRPSKRFVILNSFGKTFTVNISSLPSCDCEESKTLSPCKHTLFILVKVLESLVLIVSLKMIEPRS
jgi:hypothetical protein